MSRPFRPTSAATRAASILLALACLAIIAARHDEVRERAAAARSEREAFETYLDRFAGLGRALRGVEVVGYAPLPSAGTSPLHDLGFFRAQYALAPVVVQASTEPRYVVGNFHTPRQRRRFERSHRWKVVQDLRNGVVLYESRGR